MIKIFKSPQFMHLKSHFHSQFIHTPKLFPHIYFPILEFKAYILQSHLDILKFLHFINQLYLHDFGQE